MQPLEPFVQPGSRRGRISVTTALISEDRLASAKCSYTTRNVPRDAMANVLQGELAPRPGDIALVRVERLGQHKAIELPSGRRAQLYVGDELIVSYGNRYAPDQFEALVPDNLNRCHFVTSGGVVSFVLARHSGSKRPTLVRPIGLVADSFGNRLNLADWATIKSCSDTTLPVVVAVVGTSMEAGKTTTAASLIRGLVKAGTKVGAAKVTGTGAGRDRWRMLDAGALEVVDFTDAGFPSTYRLALPQLEGMLKDLTAHLAELDCDIIVVEVADGVLQEETASLLTSPTCAAIVSGVIFAARDAMGAVAGVAWLKERRLPVLAVSGVLTASPLASREAALATGALVLSPKVLSAGEWLPGGLDGKKQRARLKTKAKADHALNSAYTASIKSKVSL